jgi:hypothetical protein
MCTSVLDHRVRNGKSHPACPICSARISRATKTILYNDDPSQRDESSDDEVDCTNWPVHYGLEHVIEIEDKPLPQRKETIYVSTNPKHPTKIVLGSLVFFVYLDPSLKLSSLNRFLAFFVFSVDLGPGLKLSSLNRFLALSVIFLRLALIS